MRESKFLVKSIVLLICLSSAVSMLARQSGYPPPPPQRGDWGQRGREGRGGTDADRQSTLDRLNKMLAWRLNSPDTSSEGAFLCARAAELYERLKQSKGNSFQFDWLADATESLLRACDRIFMARKANQIDENDKRDAALKLQKCYFRILQADYFAGLGGEKDAKQYVTYSRSLYQQARSAYDAHQYDRAQMLGDASSLIVSALENIALASLRIPDPPVIK